VAAERQSYSLQSWDQVFEMMDRQAGHSQPKGEDRALPDVEGALIRACMLEPDGFVIARGLVTADDFYVPHFRALWQAMVAAADAGSPLDVAPIQAHAMRLGVWSVARIGFDQAMDSGHFVFSVPETCAQLRNLSSARKVGALGLKLSLLARDWSVPLEDLRNRATHELAASVSTHGKDTPTLAAHVTAFEDRLMASVEGRPKPKGLTCGIVACDSILSGRMLPGQLIIVGARPAMGKTSWLQRVAMHIAKHYGRVLFFSLEMRAEELLDRAVAMAGGFPLEEVKNPPPHIALHRATDMARMANAVGQLPLMIADDGGQRVSDLAVRARLEHAKSPLRAIAVDYLQLVKGADSRGDRNREQEVGEVSRELKSLAKELDVPIIALSQLNRGLETRAEKRPTLADLRESGSLEQDADVVAFLYREVVYDPKADPTRAEFIVAKQRDGATGTVMLRWRGAIVRYEDDETEFAPPPRAHIAELSDLEDGAWVE
jgi:replicative DNA helicase